MSEIDLAAWVQGLDIGVAEVADVLNSATQRAAELHWSVVVLAESLRRNPDPEVRVALCSADAALDFLSHRLEDAWLAARRGAR
jgi:hypothetical protein